MENSRVVNFIFLSLLEGLLLVVPFTSLAYDDRRTHPALTEEIINFYIKSFGDKKPDDVEKEFIIQGSIDEDKGIRWMHHYYDPVFNRGLTLGSDKSVNSNLAFIGGAPITSKWSSSKEWAQNSSSQSGLTGLMGSLFRGYFSDADDYSWERGIYEYTWGDQQRGLESLGHILHLIEDASVPDHTRNDPHPGLEKSLASVITPDLLLNYLGSHDVTNGSPYEGYAIFDRGSLNIAQEIENEKPIIARTLDEYFTKIATYSNNYFFSRDTIIGSPYQSPKVENLERKVEKLSDGNAYLFGYVKDNNGKSIKILQIKENNILDEYSINDRDNKIMKEYWTYLSRQAILHGAGVVKLFFDEVEKEKKTKVLYEKNRSWVGKTYDSFTQAVFGTASLLSGISATKQDSDTVSPVAESVSPTPIPPTPSVSVSSTPSVVIPSPSFSPTPSPVPFTVQPTISSILVSKPLSSLSSISESRSGGTSAPIQVSGSSNSTQQSFSVQQHSLSDSPVLSSFPLPSPSPSPFPDATSTFATSTDATTTTLTSATTTITIATSTPTTTATSSSPIITDTQSPSLSFSIFPCTQSLSPDGCLIATTTMTLAWSSSDSDLDHYILECVTNAVACPNFSFASTTATSTTYIATNTASYIFNAKAVDTSGNESEQKTISPEVSLRPVVINEIAWAGTGSSPVTNKDEWVELYNTTSKNVSLANMILNSPSNHSFKINLSGVIDAHGFYLIERTNDDVITNISANLTTSFGSGLSNSGEQLSLVLGSTTIDKTPPIGACRTWCGTGGINYKTMERYDPMVSGEKSTNWFEWTNIVAFGDNAEGQPIKGTPKHRNSINYLIISGSSSLSVNKTLTSSNSPYVIPTQTAINAPLTIEPGVVIKFKGVNAGLYGNALIIAQGTHADPIVFTSFTDDFYGGDTNGNGTSTLPQAGDWGTIKLLKNGSIIDHAIVRFGGGDNEGTNVKVKQASVDITNSVIEESKYRGMSLENALGTVMSNTIQKNTSHGMVVVDGNLVIRGNTFAKNDTGLFMYSGGGAHDISVENNIFTDNRGDAIRTDTINPVFSGNAATGNGSNGIVLGGSMTQNYTLSPDLPYIWESHYQVNQEKTLTMVAGTIVKSRSSGTLMVSGSLYAQGTSERPIIFTSIHDDDCGIIGGCGDTDGTTTPPVGGDWNALWFDPTSSTSTLDHAVVRFGGSTDNGAVHINSRSTVEIKHSIIEKNHRMGIFVDHSSPLISDSVIQDTTPNGSFGLFLISSSTPTITNTHFKNNTTHISNDSTSTSTDGGGNVW